MVWVKSSLKMENSMKENFLRIKSMEKEDIFMRKVYIMKVVGKIMFDKVTVE
jgi:hypothetical protein